MTDEEILKSVAIIEGHDQNNIDWWQGNYVHLQGDGPEGRWSEAWNPLHNPADLLALIEKYRLDISAEMDRWEVSYTDMTKPGHPEPVVHPSLPHAVLMAIIEAHK